MAIIEGQAHKKRDREKSIIGYLGLRVNFNKIIMLRSFRETYNSSLILEDSNCSKLMFGLGPSRDKFELVVTSKTTHVNLNEFVKLSLHVVSACVTIPNTTSKWPINSWKITVEGVGVKITHGACLDVSQASFEKRPFPIIQKPPVIHKISQSLFAFLKKPASSASHAIPFPHISKHFTLLSKPPDPPQAEEYKSTPLTA